MSSTWKGNAQPAKFKTAKRKGLEAFLLLVAVIALMSAMVYAGVVLHAKYQRFTHPDSLIYGVWVEHDVAAYQAESLVIEEYGVIINGGVVATDFEFDGNYFVYQHGNQERRFKFQHENWEQMTLQTRQGYQPVFIKSPRQELSAL